MKKLIQYYDKNKLNQISVEDLAIDIYQTLPHHIEEFGAENVAIYVDNDTKSRLNNLSIASNCIKIVQPLDNINHTIRWLSILAQQTEDFQICPLGMTVDKRASDNLEVSELIISDDIPVLDQLGIGQTGGICGGDIINMPTAWLSREAYCDARDKINNIIDNNDGNISEDICKIIMGTYLYKTAKGMNINIVKYP